MCAVIEAKGNPVKCWCMIVQCICFNANINNNKISAVWQFLKPRQKVIYRPKKLFIINNIKKNAHKVKAINEITE